MVWSAHLHDWDWTYGLLPGGVCLRKNEYGNKCCIDYLIHFSAEYPASTTLTLLHRIRVSTICWIWTVRLFRWTMARSRFRYITCSKKNWAWATRFGSIMVNLSVLIPSLILSVMLRWIHLETADLIGLDTVVHSLKVLYDSYQDPKFRCCPMLQKMVDAGQWGRKTGQGFYAY